MPTELQRSVAAGTRLPRVDLSLEETERLARYFARLAANVLDRNHPAKERKAALALINMENIVGMYRRGEFTEIGFDWHANIQLALEQARLTAFGPDMRPQDAAADILATLRQATLGHFIATVHIKRAAVFLQTFADSLSPFPPTIH